jgi:hypothetical protein
MHVHAHVNTHTHALVPHVQYKQAHLWHSVEQVAGVVQERVWGSGGERVHNITVDLVVAGVNIRFRLHTGGC